MVGFVQNITQYRQTFCTGDCPLTLTTSNFYCGTNNDPFEGTCMHETVYLLPYNWC